MASGRLIFVILIFLSNSFLYGQSWIRINQIGYTPKSIKNGVLLSKTDQHITNFQICDALSDEIVFVGNKIESYGKYGSFESSFRLDFSSFQKEGAFYIKADNVVSPNFVISKNLYNGKADFLLNYMRQQRCGYNPFLNDSCHTHDGFIIYHPTLDSTYIDVKGGWHDASDYLQYVTTSANATYQMLFAYQQNPNAFSDKFDANGKPGSNGIPDILDESKWGIDWLLKMNPSDELMFNQIADDRDHQSFRLPTQDSVYYGKKLERPVYYITGEPQGVLKNKNRANGKASTAGKYASTFAFASEVLGKFYPELRKTLIEKAKVAYKIGKEFPGVSQTAPCRAPYFYEEDNYVDDMQLGAISLFEVTGEKEYVLDAVKFGNKEIVTPWMGADTARHYQWYPFVNLGHAKIASSELEERKEFVNYLKEGIERVVKRGKQNPFLNGIPFIWCSNNLVAAFLTQVSLYQKITGDYSFADVEASMRDWLFGANPWGTSMIVGLPEFGVSPKDPHSAFTHVYGYPINGGLVDGPIYASIFNSLIGIHLSKKDQFKEFQSDIVVYHDDWGDYSTNEPTMDGTASLTYYFSSLANVNENEEDLVKFLGGITRLSKNEKKIYPVFTGHEFADGAEVITSTLKKHNAKASFFFTGDFYRNPQFEKIIQQLKDEDYYLGAHSDKHLLYASWEKRDSTLISKKEFKKDVADNYLAMEKFGINKEDAAFYLPPYEWYNSEISSWTEELGLRLINFTPGTSSNQDWTIPELGEKYYPSEKLYKNILSFEQNSESGLNGFLLLMHIGTDERRTDKFYNKLDNLLTELSNRGYTFESLK
jgi:peptidoglycan/xylan/chitin deacetylase (PgdA/CDA1 family)